MAKTVVKSRYQCCSVKEEDGTYWSCDDYGLYCGPEPAPYKLQDLSNYS